MKKILMLNYEYPPLGGGGGVAAHKLAKGFIKLGYQVDYLTTGFKGFKKFEIIDGINVYRVRVIGRKNLETASMISMLCYPVFAFWQGFKLCKKNNYYFINTHFIIPSGPLGYILSKIFKIRNILTIHGGDIYDPTKKLSPHKHGFLRFFIRQLLSNADMAVVQSLDTKNNVMKYYKTKQKIKIIPLPYEKFEFEKVDQKKMGMNDNKKYIIGIGRLVKRKGFEYFLRALALLNNNVWGIIIGDGPEKYNLINLAKKLNILDRIYFTKAVSEEKKFQYLTNSDVYVLSSLHEGFGIVLQEAMQAGLPIVAFDNGGQVDLIKDGVNGFLVKLKDINGLAKKINFIFKEKKIANKFREKNLNNLKKYKLKKIADSYIKLLE